jgi:hypothetical protein
MRNFNENTSNRKTYKSKISFSSNSYNSQMSPTLRSTYLQIRFQADIISGKISPGQYARNHTY